MSLGVPSGGVSGGAAGPSRSGDAAVNSGTGAKTLNIGGNPNITSGALLPVLIVGGVVLVVWFLRHRK